MELARSYGILFLVKMLLVHLYSASCIRVDKVYSFLQQISFIKLNFEPRHWVNMTRSSKNSQIPAYFPSKAKCLGAKLEIPKFDPNAAVWVKMTQCLDEKFTKYQNNWINKFID